VVKIGAIYSVVSRNARHPKTVKTPIANPPTNAGPGIPQNIAKPAVMSSHVMV
jgi:hypothetical protein